MTSTMKKAILCLGMGWTLAASAQLELPLRSSDVVATRGGVELTVELVDQKIAAMPEEIRSGYFDDPTRIARLIDSVLLTVQLSRKAEAAGVSVQVPEGTPELDRLSALANVILERQGVLQSDEDYLILARERYQARKREYATPERFTYESLFVDGQARGLVAAKILAEAAWQRASRGEDFTALVEEYSDLKGNDPLTGTIDLETFLTLPEPLRVELSALGTQPGITKVIESGSGFRILRLVEFHPPVVPPYDEVKDRIVAQLKDEAVASSKTTFMRDLSLQDVELNDAVLQRLMTRYSGAGIPQPGIVPDPVQQL